MKIQLSIAIFFLTQLVFSQNMVRVDVSTKDPYHYYLNDNDSTNLFYYKMVPEQEPIGALVLLPSSYETIESMLSQITLYQQAVENQMLVIMPSYNWGTIQQEPELEFFDTIFKQVVDEHNVPKDNFIFCGLSNGAMISLTYAVRSVRDGNRYLVPKGIIGLDPPVDLARLYKYCEREIERNFSKAGVAEAQWLKDAYDRVYGGSPDLVPMKYQDASTFTYGAKKGGNTQYLNDVAIRMHSDLNIDFLINQRKRDLHDWNGTDLVSFVNQLKLNGNQQADVIITHNKGVRANGTINPHSWSIMDTDETTRWILDVLNGDKTKKTKEKTNQLFSVNDILPKASYLEDINQLTDSLLTLHPQPYEFISERELKARINQYKNQITDSTTLGEFTNTCRAITAMVGCLHTHTSTYNVLNLTPNMFFPVRAQFINSKLYITKSYTPNPELTPGVELLKINGIDVSELKKEMTLRISADGYNEHFINANINRSFGYFCGLQLNFPTDYKVVVKHNGIEKEIHLNEEEPNYINESPQAPTKNLDFSIDSLKNTAVITIKSFVYYHDQLPIFKSFVDSCFNQIELHSIENLVIDLRGNGGGDPYCAVHLLQYISNSPFRYYKKESTMYYKDLEDSIIPFKNNFSGNLFILINSMCASTTGHLSSILKHKNIGTLIGSETGATYSCNANTTNFKLQHSRFNASVATKIYQTDVSGLVKNQGIKPDYTISRTIDDVLKKKDLEMEKVEELIHNKK